MSTALGRDASGGKRLPSELRDLSSGHRKYVEEASSSLIPISQPSLVDPGFGTENPMSQGPFSSRRIRMVGHLTFNKREN